MILHGFYAKEKLKKNLYLHSRPPSPSMANAIKNFHFFGNLSLSLKFGDLNELPYLLICCTMSQSLFVIIVIIIIITIIITMNYIWFLWFRSFFSSIEMLNPANMTNGYVILLWVLNSIYMKIWCKISLSCILSGLVDSFTVCGRCWLYKLISHKNKVAVF